jgi:hypothetical protein
MQRTRIGDTEDLRVMVSRTLVDLSRRSLPMRASIFVVFLAFGATVAVLATAGLGIPALIQLAAMIPVLVLALAGLAGLLAGEPAEPDSSYRAGGIE